VEFYLDGAKVTTDGSFPFEHRFTTPLLVSGKRSFTLRARASDTGGNATWSSELNFTLVPDATPPRVRRVQPANGAFLGSVSNLVAVFSEPLAAETLPSTSFKLTRAGADGVVGSADDEPVAGGSVSYLQTINTGLLTFPATLAPGLYQASVGPPIADSAGNVIAAAFNWTFRVYSPDDTDNDGVPDEIEPLLGLDPARSDSDGDGIADGVEDFDNDGLSNAVELIAGTDPTQLDTDGDGIRDGDEDEDNDGIRDAEEFLLGTNPLSPDSDGDGWIDGAEKDGVSNPLEANSQPIQGFITAPPLSAVLPGQAGAGSAGAVSIAQPPVKVSIGGNAP
jgi:hypothetical protein